MFLRGEYWHYDFIIDGERYRGSTGFKKNEKEKAKNAEATLKTQIREKHSVTMIWEQTKKKLSAGKDIEIDSSVVWDIFLKTGYSHSQSCRMKIYFKHLKSFCEYMQKEYSDVRFLSFVEVIHIQSWINELKDKVHLSNTTINDYIRTMNMIYNALGKNYGIVANPFTEIKRPPKEGITREAFTPEELKLIGENATGWIYSLCLTALSTGLREGDICLLKKSNVNLQNNWISVKTSKTKTIVDIPIMPGLRQHILEKYEEDPDNEYVYPELAELYINSANLIGHKIKVFFEKIGITNTMKKIAGYKKNVSVKDVHSFRHTFVYLAACNGIPFPIVQGIVGHASPEMTKHYMDHAGREAKTQYLMQMPDYITGTIPENNKREELKRMIDVLPESLIQEIYALVKNHQ